MAARYAAAVRSAAAGRWRDATMEREKPGIALVVRRWRAGRGLADNALDRARSRRWSFCKRHSKRQSLHLKDVPSASAYAALLTQYARADQEVTALVQGAPVR